MNSGPPVPRRFLTEWAKEEMVRAMDIFIADFVDGETPDADDERALVHQRDRVARFLGLPTFKPASPAPVAQEQP